MTQWVIDEKPFDVLAEQCRTSAPRFELLGRSVIALDDFKRLCAATERSMQPLRTPVRLRR